MKKLLAMMLLLVIACGVASAAVTTGTFGGQNASKEYAMSVNSDQEISFGSDTSITLPTAGVTTITYGLLTPYERSTTSDTLTSADSGKTISVDCSTGSLQCTYTLPTAAVGLNYNFVSETNEGFYVDTGVTTDTIRYAPSLVPMTSGQKLYNSGVTADSVTLFCTQSGYWNVKEINGTWSNGG